MYRVWIAVPLAALNISRVEALGVALFVEGLTDDDRRAICELSVPVDVLTARHPDLAERIEGERRNFRDLWTTNSLTATHLVGDFSATPETWRWFEAVLPVVPETLYVCVDLMTLILEQSNILAFADLIGETVDSRVLLGRLVPRRE